MNIDPEKVHRLKNQLAIILGFAELLLEELPKEDKRRPDIVYIQQAAQDAIAELTPLPAHEFSSPLNDVAKANNER